MLILTTQGRQQADSYIPFQQSSQSEVAAGLDSTSTSTSALARQERNQAAVLKCLFLRSLEPPTFCAA